MKPTNSGGLESVLAQIAGIGDRFDLPSLAEPVAVCRRLLARPPAINVAVLGGFKAGKSTFINTLAGAALLPTAAVPATAILTHVGGGPEPSARVLGLDGSVRSVPVAELADWVTEERNPRNRRAVERVEVTAPALTRLPGLVLIDTPGLGSVFAHNSATSTGLLPRLEAAVLATPSTAPLSAGDEELLRRIAALTPRFALLLTKADLCPAAQQAEVIAFVQRQLDAAGIPARIYLWSNTGAFARERQVFEEEFLAPLARDRDAAAAEIVRHRVRQLVTEARALLDLGAAAARRNEHERDQLRQALDDLSAGPAGVLATLANLEHAAKAGAMTTALEAIAPAESGLRAELWSALDAEMPQWSGTVGHCGRRYESWIRGELLGRLTAVSDSHRARLAAPVEAFARACEQLLRQFHRQLDARLREQLGVVLDLPDWQAESAALAAPDISVTPSFTFRFDWLYALLPAVLFRRWLHGHFRRRTAWETEKNLSRLAALWAARTDAAVTRVAAAARSHVSARCDEIARVLTTAPRHRAEAWQAALEALAVPAEAEG
jgi:GTP-binding protein EngB required for normal cell division